MKWAPKKGSFKKTNKQKTKLSQPLFPPPPKKKNMFDSIFILHWGGGNAVFHIHSPTVQRNEYTMVPFSLAQFPQNSSLAKAMEFGYKPCFWHLFIHTAFEVSSAVFEPGLLKIFGSGSLNYARASAGFKNPFCLGQCLKKTNKREILGRHCQTVWFSSSIFISSLYTIVLSSYQRKPISAHFD